MNNDVTGGKVHPGKGRKHKLLLSIDKVSTKSVFKFSVVQSWSQSAPHTVGGGGSYFPFLTGVAAPANLGALSAPGNCHCILMCEESAAIQIMKNYTWNNGWGQMD